MAEIAVEQKLAALADRCEAPHFGRDGVCGTCAFAHPVTTRIATTLRGNAAEEVKVTSSLCTYRERLVRPLLDLCDASNPGMLQKDLSGLPESEQVKGAFAQLSPEERGAFVTLIESFYSRLG